MNNATGIYPLNQDDGRCDDLTYTQETRFMTDGKMTSFFNSIAGSIFKVQMMIEDSLSVVECRLT
jgi:hypothetical protein